MAFRQHSLSFSGFSPMTRPARDTWSICDGQTASPARNAGISASPIGLLNHRLSCGVALVTPMCRPMAATVMKSSHAPLSVWFWGAYLVTAQTPGQPALQFQRQLGLSRYEAAFQMLHKLRAGLVRPGRDAIGDQYPVEVDETLVGGRTKGEGRCSPQGDGGRGCRSTYPATRCRRQEAQENDLRRQVAAAPRARPWSQ